MNITGRFVTLSLFLILGCKGDAAKATEEGTAESTAPAASDTELTDEVVAPAPSPPTMTPELLFTESPTAYLQTERGLLLGVDQAPLEHMCRVALGTGMVRAGKIWNAAKLLQEAPETATTTTCSTLGAFASCTFVEPEADPAMPDSKATWVFTGDTSGKPVWVGMLLGSASGNLETLAADMGMARECPRPGSE